MNNQQRVALITGASQGIGEGLVAGFRKLGYAVVANSRTIGESDDPSVFAVRGDIAQPGVGRTNRRRGASSFRSNRHRCQQRGDLRRQAVHRIHR